MFTILECLHSISGLLFGRVLNVLLKALHAIFSTKRMALGGVEVNVYFYVLCKGLEKIYKIDRNVMLPELQL